ncbi:SPFH domain-containing protein [Actinokineospora iranica]|uniref:Regulator of protease activity HflC, stomatin/prohibitin superfamily n=1 Tax=Actinokineospora iranica TaxID=1271860 RepID=A0A1G6VHN0_9PSEU|nr:SPFH domain-containing protein [Actinokineospora iranica]SDD53142.1 Regulator of protease activity HflC, stomatin/prohibitin superfamily [Actinokineospora iranica]
MNTTVTPQDIDRPELPQPHVRERVAFGAAGLPIGAVAVVLTLAGIALIGGGIVGLVGALSLADAVAVTAVVLGVLAVAAAAIAGGGLTMVEPGEARVLQFLGRYVGTVRLDGLRWVNPFTTRRKVSTRIRNHETAVMKVNDADGNPIEIAAVVVWQVQDTARAVFEVDDFIAFVAIQTETAVRHIATTYPYDAHGEHAQLSLRDNADEITHRLSAEIAARVEAAGVGVIESRITHLAYAPEIAGAMLRRQQAGAVVAARQRIVEGAVGMVELALDRLAEREVVNLDEERKAAMVSNLLVVLCSDREAHPVVNTGSLYH